VAREVVFRVVGGSAQSEAPSSTKPAQRPAAGGAVVPMTTLSSDQMSAIDTARQVVVRTAADLEKLWREHAPGRPAPAVDFAKNMVIAVFLGSRPSSGFAVQITEVRRDGDGLLVTWAERRPGPGQISATVMTSPSQIVAVPRVDGTVRFQKAGGD